MERPEQQPEEFLTCPPAEIVPAQEMSPGETTLDSRISQVVQAVVWIFVGVLLIMFGYLSWSDNTKFTLLAATCAGVALVVYWKGWDSLYKKVTRRRPRVTERTAKGAMFVSVALMISMSLYVLFDPTSLTFGEKLAFGILAAILAIINRVSKELPSQVQQPLIIATLAYGFLLPNIWLAPTRNADDAVLGRSATDRELQRLSIGKKIEDARRASDINAEIAAVDELFKKDNDRTSEQLRTLTNRLGQAGRYREAIAPLRRLVAIDEKDYRAKADLALCLLKTMISTNNPSAAEALVLYMDALPNLTGDVSYNEPAWAEATAAILTVATSGFWVDPDRALKLVDMAASRYTANAEIATNRMRMREVLLAGGYSDEKVMRDLKSGYAALINQHGGDVQAVRAAARFYARSPLWRPEADAAFARLLLLANGQAASLIDCMVYWWKIADDKTKAGEAVALLSTASELTGEEWANLGVIQATYLSDYKGAVVSIKNAIQETQPISGDLECFLAVVMHLSGSDRALVRSQFDRAFTADAKTSNMYLNYAWWRLCGGDLAGGTASLAEAKECLKEAPQASDWVEYYFLNVCQQTPDSCSEAVKEIVVRLAGVDPNVNFLRYDEVIDHANYGWKDDRDFLRLLADVIHRRRPLVDLKKSNVWQSHIEPSHPEK